MERESEMEEKLFNEKIKGLYTRITANAEIQNEVNKKILDQLNRIESQTVKTNGSVARANLEIEELKRSDIKHLLNCPVKYQVEVIQKELTEYNFIRKYPKLIFGGIFFIFVLSISGVAFELYSILNS